MQKRTKKDRNRGRGKNIFWESKNTDIQIEGEYPGKQLKIIDYKLLHKTVLYIINKQLKFEKVSNW